MISWIATAALALVVIRIVWIERKCGRKSNAALASTNEQIESIKRSATERYRAKFGRDPTGAFETIDLSKVATKKP